MTNDSAFKKSVRDLAAREGLSYTEARRRTVSAMTDLVDRMEAMGADESVEVSLVGLHTPEDANLRLPKPFFIHPNGMVSRQDHWRGEPYWLVGFEDPAASDHEITLSREEWAKDPQAAVGMCAVFMERDRKWATYNGIIDKVSDRTVTVADPGKATLHIVTHDGTFVDEIPVGHLLGHLVPADLSHARQVGWRNCEATAELLWLAFISGDPDAEQASAALDDRDTDEFDAYVTGPGVADTEKPESPESKTHE